MIGGRILDTSALLQAARGTPYMQALLYICHEHLIPLVIPAPCLADALARLRDPEQQARAPGCCGRTRCPPGPPLGPRMPRSWPPTVAGRW